ncbi:MAG: endonuclease/exonuclease/phosphatase family protein [Sulfurimonadaceae bacterium]|nr:endonuclease/exonuclease/phosphatase family protein [Sulfurimonadaceae bacterium]
MKLLISMLLLINTLVASQTIKIATYNVENLFDLKHDGYEYKEYIPNGPSLWNQTNYKKKLKNLAKVIKDVDAHIIALVEVESLSALKDLRFTLKQMGLYYEYYKIADRKNTTIKVAMLSKFPFTYTKEVFVTSSFSYRNILEAKFKINNHDLYIFANHWSSKTHPESSRIVSAKALRKRVEEIGLDKNIVLLGDFNSNYNEEFTFKKERRLNNTYGKTGINHILNTKKQDAKVKNAKLSRGELYNLWYDRYEADRYSYIYKSTKEALDNIIISQPLLVKKGLYYKDDSMKNLSLPYLFKNPKYIKRWEMVWGKIQKHKGEGYSDHLPVMAEFIVE